MKNGFTLIELLGVIAIITILSLITIPIIDKSLNQGRDKLFETQKEQLIKALKDYYSVPTNSRNLNKKDVADGETKSEEVCTSISTLKEEGYLPADVKNPKTGKAFDDKADAYVCVQKVCAHGLVSVMRNGVKTTVCAVNSSDEIIPEVVGGTTVNVDYDIYRNNWEYEYYIKIGDDIIKEYEDEST